MIHFFNRESLWIGTDLKRFQELRSRLEAAGIDYRYKVFNHLGQWGGRGTIRGSKGSLGNDPALMYQYELFVHRKDWERAGRVLTE